MASTPSRRREASTAVERCRADKPTPFGVSSIGKRPLVASTTRLVMSDGRAFSHRPTISSETPVEYTSAVSTKLPYAST
jgi:hypothetical protein